VQMMHAHAVMPPWRNHMHCLALCLWLAAKVANASRPSWRPPEAASVNVTHRQESFLTLATDFRKDARNGTDDRPEPTGTEVLSDSDETQTSSEQNSSVSCKGREDCDKLIQAAQDKVRLSTVKQAYFEDQLKALAGKIASAQQEDTQLTENLKVWKADRDSASEELQQLQNAGVEALQKIKATQVQGFEAAAKARKAPPPENTRLLVVREAAKNVAASRRVLHRGSDPTGELQGASELIATSVAMLEERLEHLDGQIAAGEKTRELLKSSLKELQQNQAHAVEQLEEAKKQLQKAQAELEALLKVHSPPPVEETHLQTQRKPPPPKITEKPKHKGSISPLADFDASLKSP